MQKRSSSYLGVQKKGFKAAAKEKLKQYRYPIFKRKPYVRVPTPVSLGIEVHFLDESLISAALGSGAAWTAKELDNATRLCLNAIAVGDTDSSRTGKKVTNKSLYIAGAIRWPSETGVAVVDNGDTVFLALVEDRQTNGAQLNSEDVYTNPSGDEQTIHRPMRNMNFTSRFRVLATETIQWTPTAAVNNASATTVSSAGPQDIPFTFAVKLNTVTTYSASTPSVADIIDVSYHLIGCHSNVNRSPILAYNSRLRFCG